MALSFHKKHKGDTIWWLDQPGIIGRPTFSFDKKTLYNVYRDYHRLTMEQKKIFDRENPCLARLFKKK